MSSAALTAVKNAESDVSVETRRFLGYAGQLGVALVVSRFASTGLVTGTRRFVGFDSGDVVEIIE